MNFTEAQLIEAITAWLFTFVRVGAVLTAGPVFSASSVPARFRVLLALAITILVEPLLPRAEPVDPLSTAALLVLAQQLAIGFAIGTVLQLAFNALVFGGQMVAYSMGLGFAHLMDPQNGVQVPTVSQFYLIFATIIFLGVDGHLRLVVLLVESFDAMPVSGAAARQHRHGHGVACRAAAEHLLRRLPGDARSRLRTAVADAAAGAPPVH